jgi:hypothetical protein
MNKPMGAVASLLPATLPGSAGDPDMSLALRNEWKETDLVEAAARSIVAVAQAA